MQECKELIKKCFSFQVKNLKKLLQKVTKLAAKSPLLPCLPKWPIESMGHPKFMLVGYPSILGCHQDRMEDVWAWL
tara:strand:- start:140 stop:367 length:228 start_codon:yes stop_codon:yes gene_type:complete